jgi:hypothetical protein
VALAVEGQGVQQGEHPVVAGEHPPEGASVGIPGGARRQGGEVLANQEARQGAEELDLAILREALDGEAPEGLREGVALV